MRSFASSREPAPIPAGASRGASAANARINAGVPATSRRNGPNVSDRVSVPSKSKTATVFMVALAALVGRSKRQASEDFAGDVAEDGHDPAQRRRYPDDL